MSSFICSPEHFNSVEQAILKLANNDNFYPDYELKDIFKKWYCRNTGYLIEDIENEIKDLFITLRELSVLCVSLQYAHHFENVNHEINNETKKLLNNTDNYKVINIIQLVKAIQCILYQIETHHLTRLRPLTRKEQNAYTAMQILEKSLMYSIVTNLKEYDSSDWEITI